MKTEVSAGGVVVKKNSTGWDVLVLQDRNDVWTFPKGKLEPGEGAQEAACREIAEEVGVTDLTLVGSLPVVHYFYTRNGRVSKTVHYFVFTSKGNEPLVSQEKEGLHDARWIPMDKAIELIGYPKTNKSLLEEAKRILEINQ